MATHIHKYINISVSIFLSIIYVNINFVTGGSMNTREVLKPSLLFPWRQGPAKLLKLD